MKAISLDLRERIVASYDQGKSTREEIAKRYQVSLGMVKKLLQQRRNTGSIGVRYDRCGRKPMILESHRQQMRTLLGKKPDLTLEELRAALKLKCTLPAIYYALAALGLTYKKRRSGPANKAVPTSSASGGRGGGGRSASTRPG
jgi:transposase